MATELKIHDAQTAILRELLFKTSAGFAEMQHQTKLSSDHFNFHVNKLIELGLVEKIEKGKYALSLKGKEYANKLDTDNNTIERQPKVAVLLIIKSKIDGQDKIVMQQRLKNPYYGYWGFPTGKIRWGESILEAAERESLEETSLSCNWSAVGVYHERVIIDDLDQFVEDKIFFLCIGEPKEGTLMEDFEGGHNEWLSLRDGFSKDKKHFANDQPVLDKLMKGGLNTDWIEEDIIEVKGEEF